MAMRSHEAVVGELKEFEITVKQRSLKPAPVASATGKLVVDASGKQKAAYPSVTKVQTNEVQTYTFQLLPSDLDRAHFTFTETPQDAKTPFPFPGDYWVFPDRFCRQCEEMSRARCSWERRCYKPPSVPKRRRASLRPEKGPTFYHPGPLFP